MNVCIVRCRNRNPSVFAGGRRRGCIRRIRLAQGRERIRQEIFKLRVGNAPAARFAAGVPDLQRFAGIVVDKGRAIDEVVVPFIITRCEERLRVRRPRFPVLRGAEQKIRPVGVAAFRVGAEQTPVFVLAFDPLHVQMPWNVRGYAVGTFQNKRVCKTLLVRPVLTVCGRVQLDKRNLTLPAVAAIVGVGIVRPHQPCIRITPDNGRRLHIIAILTVDQALIGLAVCRAGDCKAVAVLLYADEPQIGGRSCR